MPSEESADRSHEFYIAEAHGFTGEYQFTRDDFHVWDLFGVECIFAHLKFTRGQLHHHVPITAIRKFNRFGVELNVIALAIEDFFVTNLLVGKLERRFGKDNPAFRRQLNLFLAKGKFSSAENQVNESAADRDSEEARLERKGPIDRVVQFWNQGG